MLRTWPISMLGSRCPVSPRCSRKVFLFQPINHLWGSRLMEWPGAQLPSILTTALRGWFLSIRPYAATANSVFSASLSAAIGMAWTFLGSVRSTHSVTLGTPAC